MKNEQVEFSSHSDTSTIVEYGRMWAQFIISLLPYTKKGSHELTYSPSTIRTDLSINPWLSRCKLRSFVLCDYRTDKKV